MTTDPSLRPPNFARIYGYDPNSMQRKGEIQTGNSSRKEAATQILHMQNKRLVDMLQHSSTRLTNTKLQPSVSNILQHYLPTAG
jgi:hypothetical protein